ncbi:MAG: hypothetical protein ISS91_01945 [Candidatus Omnitrophica bacterium]|nr:hypothetical protein [Candidatus Omnitrophota bacterium]
MNIKTIFSVILIFCLVLAPSAGFAEDTKDAADGMNLNQLLKRLTRAGQTSMQKSDLLQEFKGYSIKGTGKVKDIIKSPGESGKALVYLTRSYRYKKYELVLTMDAESVKKVRKGSYLRFVGSFEGMALETLRFDDAKVLSKPFLWFY